MDLEHPLCQNGTCVVKFFLHVSKNEQRQRLLDRIDEPDKNWKFSQADIEELKFWNQYREAYKACLSATSTQEAPWYVVPADDKEDTRLIVSQIILDTLNGLGWKQSVETPYHRKLLLLYRQRHQRCGLCPLLLNQSARSHAGECANVKIENDH